MPCCNPELVEMVRQAIADGNLSQTAAARAIGISSGQLSAILGGKYDVENIQTSETKLRTWLDKTQKRKTIYKPLSIAFVPTSASEYIFNLAESCRMYKELGVCVGKAGVGKTTSVREYAKQHNDVILLYANNSITKRSLLEDLAEALNLNSKGSCSVLHKRCAARLHSGDFCIIVDEAEHLDADILDDLRRLADPEVGGCGLLLIGLESFLANLKSNRAEFEYLTSRMCHQKKVKELSDKGVQDICAAAGEVYAPWHKQFGKVTHNPRRLINLMNMCQRIMYKTEQKTGEACPMGEDIIATAVEQLVF